MADRNAKSGIWSLHQWGVGTRTDPTNPYGGNDGEAGRADVMCYIRGLSVAVEFKAGKAGFDFAHWRANQREWAKRWCVGVFGTDYYIFLTVGSHPSNYNPEKYSPKRSWLVPMSAFLFTESAFENKQRKAGVVVPQRTIPYRATKGYSRVLQENKLDAVTMFRAYELPWTKGSDGKPGYWSCPKLHPFYVRYLLPKRTRVFSASDAMAYEAAFSKGDTT